MYMNPIVNTIAITNGILGLSAGVILLLPSIMSFDAGSKTKPSMVLLGCSGLSVIPVSIIATTLTISTGDLGYQFLYTVPILGIGTSIVWDGTFTNSELASVTTRNKPIFTK